MSTVRLVNCKQYAAGNYIVEDPDLSKSRIFIENQAFSVEDLTPLKDFYNVNDSSNLQSSYAPLAGYYQYPQIYTQNRFAFFLNYVTRAGATEASPGHSDNWFVCLDYDNYKPNYFVKSSTGIIVGQYYNSYTSTNSRGDTFIGTDLAGIPTYRNTVSTTYSILFFEDPNETNAFWGCYRSASSGMTFGKFKFSLGGTVPVFTSQRGINRQCFFIGKNDDDTLMVAEHYAPSGSLDIYEYTMIDALAPTLRYNFYSEASNQYFYQYPSNIRHDAQYSKVFYQACWQQVYGAWDTTYREEEQKILFFRYNWNPKTKQIVRKNCTLVFPAGKNSTDFITKGHVITTTSPTAYYSQYDNPFFYKPHQFQIGDRRFVTLLFCDRSGGSYWSEHWGFYRTRRRNRWITFEIDQNDDTILTYHSFIDWENPRMVPRYYMPINTSGSQLLVTRGENWTGTLSFNLDKGWVAHNISPVTATAFGIDSAGRIYVVSNSLGSQYESTTNLYDYGESEGYSVIDIYQPNKIGLVSISQDANTNLLYTGNNISSNVYISAWDQDNERLVTSVKLKITGKNLIFSDNNSQEITITTSSSGAVTVPIVIVGSGLQIITGNMVIGEALTVDETNIFVAGSTEDIKLDISSQTFIGSDYNPYVSDPFFISGGGSEDLKNILEPELKSGFYTTIIEGRNKYPDHIVTTTAAAQEPFWS